MMNRRGVEVVTRTELAAAMRVVRRMSVAEAVEDHDFVQKVSKEVYGWIDDLKAKYPAVDIEEVRQVYGHQLESGDTQLACSAVESVYRSCARRLRQ